MATSTRARKAVLDPACAEAVEFARAAAEELAPGEVGDHLGCAPDGDRVVTHRFACASSSYRGWHWAVTVARASRSKEVTLTELVLLPGDDAVLAPVWVPWAERLRPGDLGPGDILPPPEDDDRLLPGISGEQLAAFDPAEDAETAAGIADELGLGRARVLSPAGRDDAVDRWYSGDRGPDSPLATAAPRSCSSCGFLLNLAGALGRVFGVCANEYAPDDGRVVSYDHGCGAHSEIVAAPATLAERPEPVLDHLEYDVIASSPSDDGPSGADAAAGGEGEASASAGEASASAGEPDSAEGGSGTEPSA